MGNAPEDVGRRQVGPCVCLDPTLPSAAATPRPRAGCGSWPTSPEPRRRALGAALDELAKLSVHRSMSVDHGTFLLNTGCGGPE